VKARQINEAIGKAQAIKMLAQAQAEAIELVAAAIQKAGGKDAVAMEIAKEWLKSWSAIAKESNTVIVPRDVGDVSSMVTTAMSVFQKIKEKEQIKTTPTSIVE
jgi:regulator of protease activity HflC (stomatin/prohibitin superfamily)